jgi:hypothetical protein
MSYPYVKCIPVILFVYFVQLIHASDNPFLAGARETGMANAILTLGTTWSVYHNPAGIAGNSNPSFGFSYHNQFFLEEMSTRSFAAIWPYEKGGFAASYSYYGTQIYNEQKTAIGYAHKLSEKIDAGILIDVFTSKLPGEYETVRTIAGEIGLNAHPIDQLSIGIHVKNISNSAYSKYIKQQPKSWFRAGLTWNESDFLIGTQVQLKQDGNTLLSLGTEINVVKNFDVRAGISKNETTSLTFGMGYKQQRWRGDIAFARHPQLGFSSFISVEFYLGVTDR